MYTATATIDIAAPPELVRQKFLQFSELPKYHPNGFFVKIEPQNPNKPLEPGDKLRNTFEFGSVEAEVKENSPTCFTWAGGLSLVFVGEHSFLFKQSTKIPNGTAFTQSEKFTGLFSFIMGDNMASKFVGFHEKSNKGWARYNEDLKKWCEQS